MTTDTFCFLLESTILVSSVALVAILLEVLQSYFSLSRHHNISICRIFLSFVMWMIYYTILKKRVLDLEIYQFVRVMVTTTVHQFMFICLQNVPFSIDEVFHKSVGKSSVSVQDQETSASTCCGSGVPQFLLSLLPPASSEPQPVVNIEEELRRDYVKEFRSEFDEEIVSEEKLKNAILYLNTLRGGKSFNTGVYIYRFYGFKIVHLLYCEKLLLKTPCLMFISTLN